ncbi:MAG: HPF/RaiA family ribosome-associated protein [bacterium]|jgi:ribosome-associated translation inhibitor RaiA|nr:HPF/RaiA family ribosome-associated protein [bacterium]
MRIQINTDSHVEVNDRLARKIRELVRGGLERFGGQVTRVELHLSDEDGDKSAGVESLRCLLEARLAGLQPVSVSHQAPGPEQAVDGAVEKVRRALEKTIGRLGKR